MNRIRVQLIGFLTVALCAGLIPVLSYAANTGSMDFEADGAQYLSISDGTQEDLDLTGDFTIETWYKPEDTDNGQGIVTKWDGTSANERGYAFRVVQISPTEKIRLAVSPDGASAGEVTWSRTLATGVWYHLAVVYDASEGSAELFVDGMSQGVRSGLPTSVYDSSSDFRIGAIVGGLGLEGYADGLLDDVRVWSITRTEGEIADNMLIELNGSEPGLVGYWKLNGTLIDETANGNTLTNNKGVADSSDVPFGGDTGGGGTGGGGDTGGGGESPTGSLFAVKTADESVLGSDVLQDDDDLSLALEAGKTYELEGVLFVNSSSAKPDVAFSFAGDSGFDLKAGYMSGSRGGVIGADEVGAVDISPRNYLPVFVRGIVTMGAADGEVGLRWAQVKADGNPTVLEAGSYVRAVEL